MSQNPNPFLRGYWNLKIVRTLSISHEDGSPHVWRNIHQSQEHLSDEELVSASCIVTSDFAVVSNGPDSVSAEVLAERDAGEGAGEHVDEDRPAARVDAGEARGLGVAADGIDMTPDVMVIGERGSVGDSRQQESHGRKSAVRVTRGSGCRPRTTRGRPPVAVVRSRPPP